MLFAKEVSKDVDSLEPGLLDFASIWLFGFSFKIFISYFNSEFSDFGSAFYNNKIVFASARIKPDVNENYAGWTGEKFTDLYIAEQDVDGNLSKVALLSSVLNFLS